MLTPLLATLDASHGEVGALLVILTVAAAVTMVLRRLRLATIPGYVIAGAIIGPHALALVRDPEAVEAIAGVAILLLMFTIGLHLDLAGIRSGLSHILVLGIGTTLACALLGWAAGLLAGLSPPVALTLGMALAMSSTAVVLRILHQRRQMHSMHGRIVFGVLIVQDLLALVILALLPPIAEWAGMRVDSLAAEAAQSVGSRHWLQLLLKTGIALGGIALLIGAGKMLLPRLLSEAAKEKSSETMLVLSAAIALGSAALTSYLGFSPELGAFLAGFLLAATPFKYQLSGQLAPLRDLFMAVFFTTVGLQLDTRVLVEHMAFVAIGLPLLIVGKALIIGLGTWLAGATAPTAFLTGLGLAQGSEFSLVILSVAASLRIFNEELMGESLALVVLSLAIAPGLYSLAYRWQEHFARYPTAPWIRRSPLREETAAPASPITAPRHVIIAGFGVVGRNLAEHFAVAAIPYTIVELNPATVSRQRKLGRSIIFGDISNTEVLETAGIHAAEAVILTIPDDEATLRACRAIRQLAPRVFIAARTSNLNRAIAATDLGADHVTVEEVATAQEMARQVMARLASRKVAAEAREKEAAAAPEPPRIETGTT